MTNLRTELAPLSRKALSVGQAAAVLGISRSLAYQWARSGRLRTLRAGRRFLVPVEAVDELLNALAPGRRQASGSR